MKRMMLALLIVLGSASIAAAQMIGSVANDVLGAHLNYGRGCPACHAPHSGASGNGANKSGSALAGTVALWGQDAGALAGVVINTGQSRLGKFYSEVLPPLNASTPDVLGLVTCLSCHDGNVATGAMMKNKVFETLPPTYGALNNIPTLIGNNGAGAGNYLNDHPVGLNAVIPCGGAYAWDCTYDAKGNIQPGPLMTQFINNYGFFVSPGVNAANQPVVVCTTCHNQHVMNIVPVTNGGNGLVQAPVPPAVVGTAVGTGLPTGNYATMFFVRAPYNPADANPATNQTAQFCRECHGGESNEMNGSTSGTIF